MRKALLIGINNYASAPLLGCINDATALAAVLECHENGTPNFDVLLKTNVLTKSECMSLIKELFNGDDEIVLLYFSGHGYFNELGGWIVTPDAKRHDEGISMDDVLKLAIASKARNKVILLDCCHAGGMGTPLLAGGISAVISEGITILTACRDDEQSLEINKHGVFTSLLLSALQGGAADLRGHITPGSVYAYIDQALGAWDQRPVFKTNISRFINLRSVTPPVPPAVLRKIIEYFPVPDFPFALDEEYEFTMPCSKPEKIDVFEHLQNYANVGLVVPNDEKHMYWAAINRKSCNLTMLGKHYWRLVKEKRL